MFRHRGARIALALGLFLAIAFPTAALAHRIYAGWYVVWSNGPKCVNNKITQDHGNTSWGYYPHGFWMTENKAEKETVTQLGTISCSQNFARPAGYLKTRTQVLKFNSPTGNWALCHNTGFIQSNVETAQWNVKVGSTSAPPCGSGYYTVQGNASMWWNSQWVGGGISTSEYEYLN